MNSYVGLENTQASEIFGELVREQLTAARSRRGRLRCREQSDKHTVGGPRSLPIAEWPQSDQRAWEEACRPGHRFQQGGSAVSPGGGQPPRHCHAATACSSTFWRGQAALDRDAPAAAHTTPENVANYHRELQGRVRSVTVWNCIYKLRRAFRVDGAREQIFAGSPKSRRTSPSPCSRSRNMTGWSCPSDCSKPQ